MEHLVFTDEERCISCSSCLRECPVFSANRARKSENGNRIISINFDNCIHCGRCIEVCPREARQFKDDSEAFFNDLRKGVKISLVVAPAIRTNFIHDYKNLLGYFKSIGANLIYDVSFGADITTWAYLKYIKQGNLSKISQPCPAIVNYIEKNMPLLINELVPIHSPTLCAAIYLKRYKNVTDKIAFISPCIAKKDEFDDRNTNGFVNYNVTYKKINDYLKKNNINLRNYSPVEFDNDPYGLGALYSMHGGLRENVEFYTDHSMWVKQVEGEAETYKYLRSFSERRDNGVKPDLVDVLNCRRGCNFGSATCNRSTTDEAEWQQTKMKRDLLKSPSDLEAILTRFDEELKFEDFMRSYENKQKIVKEASRKEIEAAYVRLRKDTEEEKAIDCRCCGYDTCHDMANAIALGYNFENNCIFYDRKLLIEDSKIIQEQNEQYNQSMLEVNEKHERALQLSRDMKTQLGEMLEVLNSIIAENEKSIGDIQKVSEKIVQNVSESDNVKTTIAGIGTDIKGYMDISKMVVSIADQINLLAINASIEAARSGEYGRGFAVVATEIKKLAENTKKSAASSQSINESVSPKLSDVNSFLQSFVNSMKETQEAVTHIADSSEKLGKSLLEQTQQFMESDTFSE